jgi:transcriptional regulator with XRE-family HTH domain
MSKMPDLKKVIGVNLKKAVNERGISLEQFAYENGISKGYIYDVANGKANLTVDMLETIAKGLKVKVEALLKGS